MKLLAVLGTLGMMAAPLITSAEDLLLQHNARPLQAESTPDALAPWETPVSGFFVRSHFGVPNLPHDRWTLTIDGLVEKPKTFSLSEIKKLKTKSLHAVLECSGNGRAKQSPPAPGVQWQEGAVGNAQWDGVSLHFLLAQVKIKPQARFVTLQGADRPPFPNMPPFIRSVPLEKALQDDTLLGFSMNREPLTPLHGGPLRLILPGWYGENWMKWLTHITLTEKEDSGFYMKKAYRVPKSPVAPGEAWDCTTGAVIERIPVQSLLTEPRQGEALAVGEIEIRGKAFSGERTIQQVEVSSDEGKHWVRAQLEDPHPTGGWQEFSATLTLSGPKAYLLNRPNAWSIWSRATDSQGDRQPLEPNWNPGGYAFQGVDKKSGPWANPAALRSEQLFKTKCLVCHSETLIQSQKLGLKAWQGVLQKMELFGVQLDPAQKTDLAEFLKKYSDNAHPIPKLTSYEASYESKQVGTLREKSHSKGQALFSTYCSACHGKQGEGLVGPRLFGRAIPLADFVSTVTSGRRSMPAFRLILKTGQIEDIRKYIGSQTSP